MKNQKLKMKRTPQIAVLRNAVNFAFVASLLLPMMSAASTRKPIDKARAYLDPIVLNIPGVVGSMIGGCWKNSDEDPFSEENIKKRDRPVRLCLVYLVEIEEQIPGIRSEFGQIPYDGKVQVRFQKNFPLMVNQ